MNLAPSQSRNNHFADALRNHFVIAWVLYWIVSAALPVSAVEPLHVLEAFLLQLCFVLLVFLGLSLPTAGVLLKSSPQASSRHIAHWIAWSLLLAIIGLSLQLFDKIFVQGIDYSQGIAAARVQWSALGESRHGQASSLASGSAYLLGSAYFATILLLLHERCALRTGPRLVAWALVILLLISNLMLTGGRSGLLFVFSFVFAMCARRGGCLAALVRVPLHWLILGSISVLAFVSYALYVFYARAALSGVTPYQYALDFLPYLGIMPGQTLEGLDPDSAWSSLLALTVLAASYLTHSFYSMMAILDTPPEGNGILFSHIQSLIAKIGLLTTPDQEWFLSGRFPSLPGALYHQWGVVGVFLGAAALGLISYFVVSWHSKRPNDPLSLVAFGLMHAILVLSPLLLAADFLNFPFIVTSATAASVLALITMHCGFRSQRLN